MNVVEARRYARNTRPTRVRSDDYYSFAGGLNLEDPPLKIRPGELIGVKNYEPGIRGGYARVDGFERFDSSLRPSDAEFVYLTIDNTTPGNYPSVGDIVTGGTSGATGVLLVDVLESVPAVVVSRGGSFSTSFVDGETLSANALAFGDVDGVPQENIAPTEDEITTYLVAEQDRRRALIDAVPGAGPVRGVVRFDNNIYAFRDNVGQTECKLHIASSSQWTEVPLHSTLDFTGVAGQETIPEGASITGATSAATANVRRVIYQSGAVGSDDAQGYLTLSNVVGTFSNGETLQLTSGGDPVGTANGTVTPVTLAPGGRFEFRIHNFFGHTKSIRLYGVDGKNQAFEYFIDAFGFKNLTQIRTGMSDDKPNHIGVHQTQLWLSFPGGSVQKSGVGLPLAWQVVLGAGELAIGSEVVGFIEEVGETLFVLTTDRTYYINGREGTYVLDEYNFETGAAEWTIQRIGRGLFLDTRGFASLAASDKFGNFAYSSLSGKILRLVNQLRNTETASVISRAKNLYRCFFADGRYVAIGFEGNKITGMTVCDLGITVTCTDAATDFEDKDRILYGAEDGFVYEADRGTSFDGEAIEAFARPAFHFSRTPAQRKRYRLAILDVQTTGKTNLKVAVDYSFASPEEPGNPGIDVTLPGSGGFWDVSNWGEFLWSAGLAPQARLKLEGAGENIGFLIYSKSATESSHTLQGVTLHYSPRRLSRRTT